MVVYLLALNSPVKVQLLSKQPTIQCPLLGMINKVDRVLPTAHSTGAHDIRGKAVIGYPQTAFAGTLEIEKVRAVVVGVVVRVVARDI